MRACNPNSPRIAAPIRQQGVVLIITLIVLIAMTLATIALVRSVDTSNVIVGNLAFKQGATLAGDQGTEAAINWLKPMVSTTASYTDDAANGYYATSKQIDVTGSDPSKYAVDWDSNTCNGAALCLTPAPTTVDAGAGNTVQYVIDRLCLNPVGPTVANNCQTIYSVTQGLSLGDDKYQPPPQTGRYVEFYRVISRVKGPRNTVSYVESIVHF